MRSVRKPPQQPIAALPRQLWVTPFAGKHGQSCGTTTKKVLKHPQIHQLGENEKEINIKEVQEE